MERKLFDFSNVKPIVPDDESTTASRFRSHNMSIMEALAIAVSGPDGFDPDLYAEVRRYVREYGLVANRRFTARKMID